MTGAITLIGKYVIILLMILYTAGAFLALRVRRYRALQARCVSLSIITILLHGTAFLVIYANQRDFSDILFYLAQVAFIVAGLAVYRAVYPKSNQALQCHMMMFLALGFIMLTRLKRSLAYRQFAVVCVSYVFSLVIPAMFAKLKAARRWAAVTGVVGLALLALVLAVGRSTGGAYLTIRITDSISFQPSEFVKISFVLLIAVLFRERHDIRRILFAGAVTLAHVGVLVLCRDLGAAAIYAAAFLMMLYVSTRKPVTLLAGVGAAAAALAASYLLFAHVRNRFAAWLDPWSIYQTGGYQIANSLFGISTGGWFGLGLYHGEPTKIPVVVSDMIFSAICEELGGITGICLILICLACLLMFIHVCAGLYLPFYRLTGIGLSTIYGVQVLLNIGGAVKMIPSTGVTIPFVSYGINSVVSTFILFGIMQELYIKQQNEADRKEEQRLEAYYAMEEERNARAYSGRRAGTARRRRRRGSL